MKELMMAEVDYKTGLFSNIEDPDAKTKPETYKMTPKYNDPYTQDSSARKMAKILISSSLKTQIEKTLKIQNDPILALLGTGGVDGSTEGRGYLDFFLQSADETFDEKFQIVETLGDSYAIFGLGKKPRVVNFSGVLLNTVENDWRINFIQMFEKYISISSMAKFRTKGIKNLVTMVYDSLTVRGAILNLRTAIQAANEMVTTFSFQMVVTKSDAFNIQQLKLAKNVTKVATTVAKVENKQTVLVADVPVPGLPPRAAERATIINASFVAKEESIDSLLSPQLGTDSGRLN